MRKKQPIILENIKIEDIASKGKGKGIASDGKVVFVERAIPGDVVSVKVRKKKNRYYEGFPVSFLRYSNDRVEAKCNHFGICGGCKWQNWVYSEQLKFKQKQISDHLAHIGGVRPKQIEPIAGTKQIFHYRNKMEYSFSNNRWLTRQEMEQSPSTNLSKNALGFHIPLMWDKVIDIQKCWLQNSFGDSIRNSIKTFAEEHDFSFFNLNKKQGLLRSLMIRNTEYGQWMVFVQFFENNHESIQKLLNHIHSQFPKIQSILYAVNQKMNDSIYDLDIQLFYGKRYIIEQLGDLLLEIQAKSFFQTNTKQALTLYKVVLDFADFKADEIVWDLYTGIGSIALFISKYVGQVLGIELMEDAVNDARLNAKNNQIENCRFICGDIKRVMASQSLKTLDKPDVIIVDPPREGMHKEVVDQILELRPKKIIYISCNTATQARDIKLLSSKYCLSKIKAVDMFPHTHHVENVALLEAI